MRKTYSTPAVRVSGTAVGETRNMLYGINEPLGFHRVAGSVGFNL